MDVDDFAPRLSFFFVARTTILEEVAKFRAARRIWARVMREEFGAKNPKSLMLRFHTQTAGVQLTAQQPEVNLVRVAVQGLAAVLGGTQSLHTNSFDEAIALPTDKSARLALRTQQVLAYETDVTATVDPFAGSYVIEKMTDDVEAAAVRADGQGRGAGRRGQRASSTASRRARSSAARTASPRRRTAASGSSSASTASSSTRRSRTSRSASTRPSRPSRPSGSRSCARSGTRTAVDAALADLKKAAEGTDNVLYPMKEALRARATVGEVCNALREVWGTYVPTDAF